MQKRNDNKDRIKISPALTRLFRHFRFFRHIPAKTPPAISPDIQLLYISHLISYAPTRTRESLITDHRTIHMNWLSDITQTLVYARKLSSNARTTQPATARPVTPHQAIFMNWLSDITQTLVNAHKLSSNTHTRKPVTHHQDTRSKMNEMRASATKAFLRSTTCPFCAAWLSTSYADRKAPKPAFLPNVKMPVAKLTISGKFIPNKMRLPCP